MLLLTLPVARPQNRGSAERIQVQIRLQRQKPIESFWVGWVLEGRQHFGPVIVWCRQRKFLAGQVGGGARLSIPRLFSLVHGWCDP